MKRRHLAVTLSLVIAAAATLPAGAAEAPPGSKNFNSPGSVPNYFSNEAAPFVASPNPHPAPAEPAPAAVAPAPAAAAPAPERATPLVVSPYARPHPVRTAQPVRGRPTRPARVAAARRHPAAAVSTKGHAPARTAHAARAVKSKSAAAKVRPVSAGSRRAGRG
jgi:hypothetical protein